MFKSLLSITLCTLSLSSSINCMQKTFNKQTFIETVKQTHSFDCFFYGNPLIHALVTLCCTFMKTDYESKRSLIKKSLFSEKDLNDLESYCQRYIISSQKNAYDDCFNTLKILSEQLNALVREENYKAHLQILTCCLQKIKVFQQILKPKPPLTQTLN
jgi:hypothetical protein